MLKSFSALWTIFIVILIVSVISYSRATMVAPQVRPFSALLVEHPYEHVLSIDTVSNEDFGYGKFDLKVRNSSTGRDLATTTLRVIITGQPQSRWPWQHDEPVVTYSDRLLTTDQEGRIEFDQRFDYSDRSVQYKLEVELPGDHTFSQVLN